MRFEHKKQIETWLFIYGYLKKSLELQPENSTKTKELVLKIENALDIIKADPYYCIIPAIYFDKITHFAIEEKYCIAERTIRRHKNRLLEEMAIVFFGADAIDEFAY